MYALVDDVNELKSDLTQIKADLAVIKTTVMDIRIMLSDLVRWVRQKIESDDHENRLVRLERLAGINK